MKRINAVVFCFLLALNSPALGSSVFVGYEFGQMTFNGFKNFAGEVGFNLENNTSIRFSFLNVVLSERHLSSSEASAVDGSDVEGLWRGAEFLYDFPLTKHFAISPSVGYYDTKYSHTVLDQAIRKKSPTVGLALSYSDDEVFGLNNLYWRLSISYRHYFNPIPRTTLGESFVSGDSGEITPIFFIGYRFI